jgi:D-alanine-D-alanine ligase
MLAGIDRDGVWYLQPDDAADRARASDAPLEILREPGAVLSVVPGRGVTRSGKPLEIDIVFPVLHGSFGEDGILQGLLESADLAYVGSGVLGSALSMDKDKVKRVWKEAGLPVVPWLTFHKEDFERNPGAVEAFLTAVEKNLGFPIFVKPSGIGSSVGITKARNRGELVSALAEAFRFDTKALAEKAVNAREIECSVVGNHGARAFTPGEIVPSHEFYDYDAKYIDPDGARLLIPAELAAADLAAVKAVAVQAYRLAEAEGMARVDFFYDRGTGKLFLNEINTIPGFTNISMFPRMCAHDGLFYPELLETLIELGLKRHEERGRLKFSYQ